jgi:hypothetical protein
MVEQLLKQNKGVPHNLRNHQETLEKDEIRFQKDREVLLFMYGQISNNHGMYHACC